MQQRKFMSSKLLDESKNPSLQQKATKKTSDIFCSPEPESCLSDVSFVYISDDSSCE